MNPMDRFCWILYHHESIPYDHLGCGIASILANRHQHQFSIIVSGALLSVICQANRFFKLIRFHTVVFKIHNIVMFDV